MTKKFIDFVQNKDAASFKGMFEEVVANKVFEALEARKVEVAATIFNEGSRDPMHMHKISGVYGHSPGVVEVHTNAGTHHLIHAKDTGGKMPEVGHLIDAYKHERIGDPEAHDEREKHLKAASEFNAASEIEHEHHKESVEHKGGFSSGDVKAHLMPKPKKSQGLPKHKETVKESKLHHKLSKKLSKVAHKHHKKSHEEEEE